MRGFRKERVASAVQEIVSHAIAHELNDPRLAPLTTVTRVEVTGDLLVAKVYVTVPGDASTERRTLAALQHATGYVQGIVARELNIRQCPELRFELDEAWKEARRTLELIEENRRKRELTIETESRGRQPSDEESVLDNLESPKETAE